MNRHPWHSHPVITFNGLDDTHKHRPGHDYPTRTLAELFAMEPTDRPKDEAPAFIPSSYCAYDGRAHAVQQQRGYYVSLTADVDKGDHSLEDVETIVRTFADGSAYKVHSSASNRPGAGRWRGWLPLHAPVMFQEWADAQNALFDFMEAAGIKVDRRLALAGQAVFLPNVPAVHAKSGTPLCGANGQPLYYEAASTGIDAPGLRLDAALIAPIIAGVVARREADDAAREQLRAEAAERRAKRLAAGGDSIIDWFNAAHPLDEMLLECGYVTDNDLDYRSPHQASGSYATRCFEDHWVSLSGSDAEAGVGVPGKSGQSGDAFALFVHYPHGGDMKAALKAAREERGVAGLPDDPRAPAGEVPSPPPTDEQLAAKHAQQALGDVYWSESGIATTLADAMIDQLRIAPALSDKAWFVTDAERGGWMRDDANRVMGMCHIAGQVRAKEAMAQAQTSGVTRTLASLRTAKAVAGLMALDRRLIVAPDAFDADPWLLGTPGAIVDLRTGEARGYRPEDMVSKHTAVRPADSADCPTWMDFLDTTFGGDADLIRYFQRWAGYALTGVIGDPTILVATGKGSNGKSVAFNVITGLLGDYAINADERLFKADGSSDHPAALARLQGARLVLAAEFPEARVNVDRIQRISGGDVVTARGMGEGFFDFHPQCKLAFTSNFTIQLGRVNEAIRRRIRQLPFDHTVPPDRRIVNYDKKLLEAEGPGIMRWAIDGCLAFQRDGGKLGTCAAIERATDAYFTAQDPVKRWLDENVTGLPDGWEQTTTLQADFARWAAENGERVITPKALSIELEGRGLHRHKKAAGMGFSGIALSRHPLGNVVPIRPAG